ncbi:RhoGAP-domain-containing protein, partial [Cutaneotrichosporon oleaginosum]
MVSSRPSPSPARGRVPYPSADTYIPGDDKVQEQPEAPESSTKELIMERKTSREMTEREQSSLSLRNWWKTFKTSSEPVPERSFRRAPQTMNTRRVFGVSLSRVLTYAAMQISTSAPDGSLYVWGEVPIIVGRCGAYLKNKTDIEGVFRVSGSAKRMRELQLRFDEGPKYGIDLNWETSPYTPHDVATILRRYLTQMTEPVIPWGYYNAFRAIQVSDHPPEQRVREYKRLVREMPRENQYLLLYLLDLLGIFARDSDKNLMTAANLAVIFQPGLLSHPGHDMRPAESVISKDVVQFLIENQAHFVFGMSKRMSHAHASRRSKSAAAESSSKAVQRPPPIRADTDFMLPSDSDDDAPPGGYYIIERATSPHRATSPFPQSPEPTASGVPTVDVMQPSDSDDDAPAGGYVMFENRPGMLRTSVMGRAHSAAGSTT